MTDALSHLLNIGKSIIAASEALQAEIDKHSPSSASTASSATSATSDAADEAGSVVTGRQHSSLYIQHVNNGCLDPLKLLSVQDAGRLMDCAIASPVTTGEEEYIGCHYGCADDRSMYVSLSVSALMPWDYITSEVTSQPADHQIGDEAIVAGDMLYVRQGDSFFWIYGRGVEQATISRIAEHVAAQMAEANAQRA